AATARGHGGSLSSHKPVLDVLPVQAVPRQRSGTGRRLAIASPSVGPTRSSTPPNVRQRGRAGRWLVAVVAPRNPHSRLAESEWLEASDSCDLYLGQPGPAVQTVPEQRVVVEVEGANSARGGRSARGCSGQRGWLAVIAKREAPTNDDDDDLSGSGRLVAQASFATTRQVAATRARDPRGAWRAGRDVARGGSDGDLSHRGQLGRRWRPPSAIGSRWCFRRPRNRRLRAARHDAD